MAMSLSKLFSGGFIALGIMAQTACATIEESNLSNKDKGIAVISSLETGDESAIDYINPKKYIQHNLGVVDGVEGFGTVLKLLSEGNAKVSIKRAFQDGDYVITHTEYNFFGANAGFDIFRFENGQIVEHWDNLQKLVGKNPSGHTQLDGPTEILDLHKTERNKAIVSEFVNTILIKGDMTQLTKFVGAGEGEYIQHNPEIADGLSGLGKALEDLATAGMPLIYKKNHKILGEGNFVLAIGEGTFMNQHVAFYDLFRVENNKLVEHWDTIQTIPAKSEWKNTNGKFGF